MKKLFKPILLITLIALLALSAFGCDYKKEPDQGGGGKVFSYANYTDHVLPSYSTDGITYKSSTTTYASLQKAAMAVRGSSVAISVSNGKEGVAGSGVIVDISDGTLGSNQFYVLTCNHVLENSGSSITVYLPDEEFNYGNPTYTLTGRLDVANVVYGVNLVGGDKESDVGVLKITVPSTIKNKIVKAPIMSETLSPEYAESVFAIGNPSGNLPGTYSEGTIAYLNRKESVETVGDMYLTQISLFTNHGSSGGGLYNIKGELIGITNAGEDAYQGLNFAIPHAIPKDVRGESAIDNGFINIAKNLIASRNNMQNNFGYVYGKHALFGFSTTSAGNGLIVSNVAEDSMANGKLVVGDIIYAIKNQNGYFNTLTNEILTSRINETGVGNEFTLYVNRSGKNTEVKFKVYQYYLFNTGNYTTK